LAEWVVGANVEAAAGAGDLWAQTRVGVSTTENTSETCTDAGFNDGLVAGLRINEENEINSDESECKFHNVMVQTKSGVTRFPHINLFKGRSEGEALEEFFRVGCTYTSTRGSTVHQPPPSQHLGCLDHFSVRFWVRRVSQTQTALH
jgi:hypothetical protein